MAVAFPFGHGLSYTTFGYADLEVESDASGITARVTVSNTGDRAGREVVQCYTAKPGSAVVRRPRELKGFADVTLAPGASQRVEVRLRREHLACWETRADRWIVEDGEYRVSVGASSRDLRATAPVTSAGDRLPNTLDSTLGEAMADPTAAPVLGGFLAPSTPAGTDTGQKALGTDKARMIASIPLKRPAGFGGTGPAELETLITALNAAHEETGHREPGDR